VVAVKRNPHILTLHPNCACRRPLEVSNWQVVQCRQEFSQLSLRHARPFAFSICVLVFNWILEFGPVLGGAVGLYALAVANHSSPHRER
jgi:hypothetical protein